MKLAKRLAGSLEVLTGTVDVEAMKRNIALLSREEKALIEENHVLRQKVANMEAMEELRFYIEYPDPIDENWEAPNEEYMKVLVCRICKDVIGLRKDKWRTCACGNSGGQYCPDNTTAVVGGEAVVLGLPNTLFEVDFMKSPLDILATRRKHHWTTDVWWGEFKGDTQILRVYGAKSSVPEDWKERREQLKLDGGSKGRLVVSETQ